MTALARGQASDCSNPTLDLYTLVNGVRTDMYSVEFQIHEKVTNPGVPQQVYPAVAGTRAPVNVSDLCPTGHKLGTGRYVAEWTPELTAPLGTWMVQWYFKLTLSSPEQTFCEDFQVLPEATGATALGYCTVQDLRDEGVPVSVADDARLQLLIARASRYVDKFTQRYFLPRDLVVSLDGTGLRSIHLDIPIVTITAAQIDEVVLDLDDLLIYNRHITQGLTFPDDREDPRIEVRQSLHDVERFALGLEVFPIGQHNVHLTGVFGYTEPDGSPYGSVPPLICEATKMLVMRELAPKYTAGPLDDWWMSHAIVEMKTRDQTIKFASPSTLGPAGPGLYTGDRRIDNILMQYRLPPRMRSV